MHPLQLGFGLLTFLCYNSFGRLERKHSDTPSLRHHIFYDVQALSSCPSLDDPSCTLNDEVNTVSSESFDQDSSGFDCWPNCPMIVTVTISQNNSPLPTNAFTVTIGGSASHSAITTSAVASSTSSSFSTSLTNTSTQQTSTSSIGSVTDSASVTRNTFIPTPVASPSSTTQVNQLSSISSTSTTATPTTSSSISSSNLQTFTNALGNIPAPPVFDTGNGEFIVQGDSTFNNKQNALDRSCDVQHNDCGNAANANHDASFTVNDCDSQEAQCKTNAQT